MRRIAILLFFVIATTLFGGYWVKKIDTSEGKIVFDEKNGRFFTFRGSFSFITLEGEIYRNGRFSTKGEWDWKDYVNIRVAEKLDDGTIFGSGPVYYDGEHRRAFFSKISLNGELILARELIQGGKNLIPLDLLQLDSIVKACVLYTDESNNGWLTILTFSKGVDLLRSKKLLYYSDDYSIFSSYNSSEKIDSNHYALSMCGGFYKNNKWYDGILFLVLDENDNITSSKIFYDKRTESRSWEFRYESRVSKRTSDGGIGIFVVKKIFENNYYTYSYLFLKIDKNWNFQWSREFIPGLITEKRTDWRLKENFCEDEEGFILGFSSDILQGEQRYYIPMLIKIDKNGQTIWSKKYIAGGLANEGLNDLIRTPDGRMIMSTGWDNNRYYYILNKKGEISDNCQIPEPVEIINVNKNFSEKTVPSNIFLISDFDTNVPEVAATFYPYESEVTNTLCEYFTMNGSCLRNVITERSLLSGYYEITEKITFTVEQEILVYISKFNVYGKNQGETDFSLLNEINKETGRTGYEVEFKFRGNNRNIGRSEYKIIAVNENDGVVDMTPSIIPETNGVIRNQEE